MPGLKVLYLKDNDVIRNIPNYRKSLIAKIPNLTYLDERPVKEEDHLAAEAYFRGGYEEERKVREDLSKGNDKISQIREKEKESFKASFEERKAKTLELLKIEYNKKKEELSNKKRDLLKEIENNPGEKKKQIISQLYAIDYQLAENEKFKVKEETDVISAMNKREKIDKFLIFEFEDWMTPIFELHVVENLFDFSRAVKLIQMDLRIRNVKNWELFNELDLRTKWTELEIKQFRTNEEDNFLNTQPLTSKSNNVTHVDEMINSNNIKEKLINTTSPNHISTSVVEEEIVDTKMKNKIQIGNFNDLD
jgi:hypothetical protein